jgi:hypothetical protein
LRSLPAKSNNWSELAARYQRENKAADRVREALYRAGAPYSAKNGMDTALINERKATVERIREELMHLDGFRPDGKRRINAYNLDIEAVLDAEAARE